MFKRATVILFLSIGVLHQGSAFAITPTFHVNQEMDFGTLILSTGSCLMIATTGALTAFQGNFLCTLPDGSHNGNYTIIANPNKTVQVRILPSLDHGDGIVFNVRAFMSSDSESKGIVNKTDFVEIDSGASGIINIEVGGELFINSVFPAGQTKTFTFDGGIEWDEL